MQEGDFFDMSKSILHLTCMVSTLLLLPGCVHDKLHENISKRTVEHDQDVKSIDYALKNTKLTNISWAESTALLEKQNLSYLSTIDAAESAKKSVKEQWYTLLPRLSAFVNLSSDLSNVTSVGDDNISLSILSNFTIPNPFLFYAQRYALALIAYNTELQVEIARRNLRIQLYRMYLQQDALDKQKAELSYKKKAIESGTLDQLATEIRNAEQSSDRIKTQERILRRQINSFFNTPGANWRLIGSPPKIDYSSRITKLNMSGEYGKIGRLLQVLQIETAVISLWNVKFSRLPQINIGLTSPAIFQSQADSSFNLEDFTLFSGLSKTIILNDPLDKKQLKDTEKRLKFTRARLRLQIENELNQLENIKSRYAMVKKRKSELIKEMNYIERGSGFSDVDVLVAQVEQIETIKSQIEALQIQQKQLDLQLWLWDESYWKYLK